MNILFILTFILGSSFIAENKLESACRWLVQSDSLCFLRKEALVDGFCGSVIQLPLVSLGQALCVTQRACPRLIFGTISEMDRIVYIGSFPPNFN
mgnify:FL=1